MRLDNVYQSGSSLDDFWDRAADLVLKKHHSLAVEGFPRNATVVVDLPSTFFSLMTISCIEQAAEAARVLRFSPVVTQLADRILSIIERKGLSPFNGIHFRRERTLVKVG